MIDFTNVRLGRKPHNPERIAAVRPHVMGTTAPAPLILPRSDLTWTPTLARNNVDATCTVAGLINSARIWALMHGFDLVYSEESLMAFFCAVAGVPNTPEAIAAVDGLVMQDVLDHAKVHGFNIGAQSPLVPLATRVDPQDVTALKDVINSRGSVYIGINLYAQDMAPGAIWRGADAVTSPFVGGHCDCPWNYPKPNEYGQATWGETMVSDEAWLLSHIDEAWAIEWTFPV